MREIEAEILSLIEKHKIDQAAPLNLKEFSFVKDVVKIVERERREVSEYAVSKIKGD